MIPSNATWGILDVIGSEGDLVVWVDFGGVAVGHGVDSENEGEICLTDKRLSVIVLSVAGNDAGDETGSGL